MANSDLKIGVTVGKFKPMHLGHELMIQMAANELDFLTVIVSDNAEGDIVDDICIPLDSRYEQVKAHLKHLKNVTVVKHIDVFGDADRYDEHGTAVDDKFWEYWINVFNTLAPDANYFVSSDKYGQEAARRISASDPSRVCVWFPVDPDREMFDVSATRIRQDPISNWKYISKDYRTLFGKRVVILGAESSGKSTLARAVGQSLNSPVVPEYGRILSEAHNNNLTEEHFLQIAKRHRFMEDAAIKNSTTGLAISDTDAYTTFLFSEIFLNSALHELKQMHLPSRYDLVVILSPDLNWDDDGTRILPEQELREKFTKSIEHKYRNHRNVLKIEGVTDLDKRVQMVGSAISELMFPVSNN